MGLKERRGYMLEYDYERMYDAFLGIDTKEEVLNEVMRRWSDIPRDEMCLIGDTMFDIEGANRVNVPCIAVSFGFGEVNEMVSAGAKAVIDDIRQLPDVLSRLFD